MILKMPYLMRRSTIAKEIATLRRIVIPLKRIMLELTSRDIKKFSSSDEDDDDEDEDLISYFDDINNSISQKF